MSVWWLLEPVMQVFILSYPAFSGCKSLSACRCFWPQSFSTPPSPPSSSVHVVIFIHPSCGALYPGFSRQPSHSWRSAAFSNNALLSAHTHLRARCNLWESNGAPEGMLCCVAFPSPPLLPLLPSTSPHISFPLSSSRQILPGDQIILHAHKRDREKERGGRDEGGGGLELDDVIM